MSPSQTTSSTLTCHGHPPTAVTICSYIRHGPQRASWPRYQTLPGGHPVTPQTTRHGPTPFSQLLKVRRLLANLSRQRLAANAGLSEATIKFLEMGRTEPSLRSLLNLLQAPSLGLYLFDLPEPYQTQVRKFLASEPTVCVSSKAIPSGDKVGAGPNQTCVNFTAEQRCSRGQDRLCIAAPGDRNPAR